MTTDLIVAVPHTGEVLDLPNETAERLACVVDEIRDLESRLRELKQLVSIEMHRRFDRDRKWSMEAGEYRITGKSDAPVAVWDAEALQEVLDGMLDENLISTDAAQRAIQPRIELKVLAVGVNALLKNPSLAERIEACRIMVEPTDRRLKIERL